MQEERRNLKEFKELIYKAKMIYKCPQKEIADKCGYCEGYFSMVARGEKRVTDEIMYRLRGVIKEAMIKNYKMQLNKTKSTT